jgi:transketolase
MVQYALKVANILRERGVNLAVINISCPLSINLDELKKYIEKGIMFTYEDHNINTGLFSIVAENIIKNGLSCKVVPFGIKKYGFSGKPVEILKLMKLDPEYISKSIKELIQSYN